MSTSFYPRPGILLLLLTSGVIFTRAEGGDFSLLPRSLQKNPLVDQTVITEKTPAGKEVAPPSTAHPAYYAIQAAGYQTLGHPIVGKRPPSDESFRPALTRALSTHGYQPAGPGHPAALLFIYHWGSAGPMESGDEDTPGFTDPGGVNLLAAARVTGGDKFARELSIALDRQDSQNEYHAGMDRLERRFAQMGVSVQLGVDLPDVAQPFRRFADRDDRTRLLLEQALGNFYYVILSAYDYTAAAKGQRVLLWRTKMSVEADGVSWADTVPTLVLNAGKYFGKDMADAATLSSRVSRGEVKVHDLEVKEYLPPSLDKRPAETSPPPAR